MPESDTGTPSGNESSSDAERDVVEIVDSCTLEAVVNRLPIRLDTEEASKPHEAPKIF